MKTAVSIPDRIFESAERFTRRRGMTRSELYAKALDAYLEEHKLAVDDGLRTALEL
jgi:metal-responsive CopG/Arc/MetJ family transcriptional regulator